MEFLCSIKTRVARYAVMSARAVLAPGQGIAKRAGMGRIWFRSSRTPSFSRNTILCLWLGNLNSGRTRASNGSKKKHTAETSTNRLSRTWFLGWILRQKLR